MLRRKLKLETVSPNQGEYDSGIEPEPEVITKKRTFRDDEAARQLEKVVFGAEEEALDEVQKFSDTVKRKKTRSERVERKAKWEDEDGAVHTKLQLQPNWASLDRKRLSDDESDDDLARSTGDYLAPSIDLPSTILDIKKCANANRELPSRRKIKSVEFHQNSQLILTAGVDGRLCFFQVDGKCNPKIESVEFDSFPIVKAHFTKDGDSVVLGSWHKSFKIFDMNSMKISRACIKGIDYAPNTKNFVISPDGKHMCLVGQYGHLHLLSVKTRELVHTFRMNGPAEAICFNSNGDTLLSHGDDGEVFIWDVRSRTCRHKFVDEGCTKGTSLSVSNGDYYVAAGSYSGVVNVYDQTCFETKSPKPLKAIMNLTTSCTSLAFNSTAEILATASDFTESAIKLVHVPTQTVFSNFPKTPNRVHVPMTLDFSPNSGYLSVGNNKGKVILYRLGHYSNY